MSDAPQIGPRAFHCITHFEGVRLRAYQCPAGKWTIGYGHTKTAKPGMTISLAQAYELLRQDLRYFEKGVHEAVKNVHTTMGQFGAMVSLAFNIGLAGFKKTSVYRNHIQENYIAAADSFLRLVKYRDRQTGNLQNSRGLIRRRRAERALYLGDFQLFDQLTDYKEPQR